MQWDEVDWDKKLWTVPAERMKGGREHQVPLSDRAMEILKLQRQYANGSPFVFTGYNRTRLAERTMRSVLHYMKVDCTVHGFRSVFRDTGVAIKQVFSVNTSRHASRTGSATVSNWRIAG
jgi:integrase